MASSKRAVRGIKAMEDIIVVRKAVSNNADLQIQIQ